MPIGLLPLLALTSLASAADVPLPAQTLAEMSRWRNVAAWEGTFVVVDRVHSVKGNNVASQATRTDPGRLTHAVSAAAIVGDSIKTASGHIILGKVTSTETLPGEKPPAWAGASVWKGTAKGRLSIHQREVVTNDSGTVVPESTADGGGTDERAAELAIRATKGTHSGQVEGWYADTTYVHTTYGPTKTFSSSGEARDSMDLDIDVNAKITSDTLGDWQLYWDSRTPPAQTTDKPFSGLLQDKGLRLTGGCRGLLGGCAGHMVSARTSRLWGFPRWYAR